MFPRLAGIGSVLTLQLCDGCASGAAAQGQGIVQLDSAAFAAAIDDVLADRPLRLVTIRCVRRLSNNGDAFSYRSVRSGAGSQPGDRTALPLKTH